MRRRGSSASGKPQIFLSFALSDRAFAERVGAVLRHSGLDVVRMDELGGPEGSYNDTVRKALHGSDAVVVALSSVSRQQDLPTSVLFEIGAAVGAEKRIFIIASDPAAKLRSALGTSNSSP